MPLSKESRQRLLDAKLFKGELVNFQLFNDYLEEFYEETIDKRTFERDIKSLKTMLADKHDDDSRKMLFYDRNRDSYYYENGFFAFEETALVKGTKLGKLLKYNRNIITDIDRSVRNQIDALIKTFIDDEEIKISWEPVQFINNENGGQENFPILLDHIISAQPIKFEHKNFRTGETKTQHTIPLLLKELDNDFAKGWYMLGQKFKDGDSHKHLEIKNLSLFAIDRIENIVKYRPHINISYEDTFNPNDYFTHAFRGIHRENLSNPEFGPIKVKLEIKADWITEFLIKYPLHTSQILDLKRERKYAEYFIEPAFDLRKFIFSHSEALLVIEPKSLKEGVIDMIKKSSKIYGI